MRVVDRGRLDISEQSRTVNLGLVCRGGWAIIVGGSIVDSLQKTATFVRGVRVARISFTCSCNAVSRTQIALITDDNFYRR